MASTAYLVVYNGHLGQFVKIPKPVRFHTINEFREYVAALFSIADPSSLFLLTLFGIRLNFNLVNEVGDVYVFDRGLFTGEVESAPLKPPADFSGGSGVVEPPLDPLARAGWARAVLHDIVGVERHLAQETKTVNVLFNAVNIVFQFGANYTRDIEQKLFTPRFLEVKGLNDKTLADAWPEHYRALEKMPPVVLASGHTIALALLIPRKLLEEAASHLRQQLPQVIEGFNDLNTRYQRCQSDAEVVETLIRALRSELATLFRGFDLEDAVTRIRLTAEQPTVSESDAQRIYRDASGAYAHRHAVLAFKHRLQTEAGAIYHKIALGQKQMVEIKHAAAAHTPAVELIKRAENRLLLSLDLPMLFGFVMIERRRQWEWQQYFSLGIVSAVLEQLALLVELERLFQRTWVRKYLGFLTFFVDQAQLVLTVPLVDVLLGGGALALMGLDGDVERKDITAYISSLADPRFVEVLTRDYKEMVLLNQSMTRMNKVIGLFATLALVADSGDGDVDAHLIKGYKLRIKKLESLVHQQQYKNLAGWPVSQQGVPPPSRLVSTGSILGPRPGPPREATGSSRLLPPSDPTALLKRHSLPASNGAQLDALVIDKHIDNIRLRRANDELLAANTALERRAAGHSAELERAHAEAEAAANELKEAHAKTLEQMELAHAQALEKQASAMQAELDAAHAKVVALTGPDLELEGLKLECRLNTKEIAALERKVDARDQRIAELEAALAKASRASEEPVSDGHDTANLTTQVTALGNQLAHAQGELRESSSELTAVKDELREAKHSLGEAEAETHRLQARVSELESQATGMLTATTALEATKKDLERANQLLAEQVSEYQTMNRDLMANMAAKEADATKLHHELEHELDKVRVRADDADDEASNYSELVVDLSNIIILVLGHLRRAVALSHRQFVELCLVLELMGLLLVRELGVCKVTRVKGLRAKRDEEAVGPSEVPSTEVYGEVSQQMLWLDNLAGFLSVAPPEGAGESVREQLLALIAHFNKSFGPDADFDALMLFLEFERGVKLQDDSDTQRFFLNAISKRFRDVEGFAKRQTKENKQKQAELLRVAARLAHKISMLQFEVGDLVLFLPTRIEGQAAHEPAPWAAFNIGAPHHFLQDLKLLEGEWMVGRVEAIAEHRVTAENVDDREANPFQLSVGVVWYMVQAHRQYG